MENSLTFAELIDKRMKLLNMSQRRLAELAGVDVSYINKLLKGKTVNPSYTVTIKIANVLYISNSELYNLFNIDTEEHLDFFDKEETLTPIDERDKINDIAKFISRNDMMDLKNMADVIYKLSELQDIRKAREVKDDCYIISNILDNLTILQAKKIDRKFLSLYSNFLDFNESEFLIAKNITSIPNNADFYTLSDLVNIIDNMPNSEDYDDLKGYIQQIL